jgi:hypothetical protein
MVAWAAREKRYGWQPYGWSSRHIGSRRPEPVVHLQRLRRNSSKPEKYLCWSSYIAR